MLLRRIGSKTKIAHRIIPYFPEHSLYVELFFGGGSVFFSKPKAKYNIVNDLNDDVFNLYQVVLNQKEELIEAIKLMPFHESLLQYWKENKEIDPIKKAIRFLFLSNNTILGTGTSLRFGQHVVNKVILQQIKKTFDFLYEVQFTNCDFREVFKKVEFKNREKDIFIYVDPPYLSTSNNYELTEFTESDSADLFRLLKEKGTKWAMSEFKHPFILEQVKKYNLNIIPIGERTNLKNRRSEILITNYEKRNRLFY